MPWSRHRSEGLLMEAFTPHLSFTVCCSRLYRWTSQEVSMYMYTHRIKVMVYIPKDLLNLTYLSLKALNQVANCHTWWDGMWIDDDIGTNTLTCERHILNMKQHITVRPNSSDSCVHSHTCTTHLLSVGDAACTFLAVATGKLVTNLGSPHWPNPDLTELVAILVDREHHLVHNTGLTGAKLCASISLCKPSWSSFKLLLEKIGNGGRENVREEGREGGR